MARWFWAFVTFNVYALFLLSAFQQNTPYLFDAKLLSDLRAAGQVFDIADWGWKNHYVWRLFSGVVVTAAAAFVTGAVAQTKSGAVAVVANIPSIVLWAGMFYIAAFSPTPMEGNTGFAVVSVIAVPLTTWVAYYFGRLGGETQAAAFSADTVLGIRPYHWAWIVFPLYVYMVGMVFVFAKLVVVEFLTWRDMSIVGGVIGLLATIPIIAWVLPITFGYKILSGEALSEKAPAVRALANTGIIAGGLIPAFGVQVACLWLLAKLMSWWY
jgi:hypothetical protein